MYRESVARVGGNLDGIDRDDSKSEFCVRLLITRADGGYNSKQLTDFGTGGP